jgi:hypothetical protein
MSRFVLKTIQRLSSLIGFFSPKKHRKATAGAFVFAALFGVFFVASPVYALSMPDVANAFLWAFSQIMLALARVCIALSVFALKFFIEIAKYNGYVDTPTVVLGWTMVRDVANMFFVVILLVIAFATILGVEQYEWKKTLVKLVLAAVFINFSKLITGLIIDFAHVFTITFLSAVSATAGGNLINMFHLNDIYRITGREFGDGTDNVQIEVFIGAVIAFLFAGLTLISMAAYLVVMIARVVVLWALIILSPIAFILQVLPTTQQWAKEWWDRFGKQVMVAPVMVFFLWLSFATLGTGDFVSQPVERGGLGLSLDVKEAAGVGVGGSSGATGSSANRVSISDVGTWENMSNFLISMAFLMVGLGVVNKLGAVGGGLVSSGLSFGKRVATIATGYAAGRYLVGRGAEIGGKAAKGALYNLPVVGGRTIATKAKTTREALKGWYYEKGYGLTKKGEQLRIESGRLQDQYRRSTKPEERTRIRGRLQEIEKQIEKESAGGVLGWTARRRMAEEKQLAKTEKQAEVRKKLLWKRTGSEAGGKVLAGMGIGMGTKGIGIGRMRIFGDRYVNDPELAGQVYGKGYAAADRVERGWLQAEEARGDAKDKEFEGLGLNQGLTRGRQKYDIKSGKLTYQVAKGSVQDQIEQHLVGAEQHSQSLEKHKSEAKINVMLGGVKAATGADFEKVQQTQAMAKVVESLRSAEENKVANKAMLDLWEEGLGNRDSDAWKMATAQAEAGEEELIQKTRHNVLLSDAEQEAVWDKRGIKTPTTALVEPFEKYSKDFAEMSYDQVMNTFQEAFLTYSTRTASGETTEADKLALGGLFQRAFDGAWIDDVIEGTRRNTDMKKKLEDNLNWKDNEMTPEKLRDIHMMFASGVDMDFVRQNSVVTSLADLAGQKKYGGLKVEEVHERIRNGTLEQYMKAASPDFQNDLDDLVDKSSGLQNTDIATVISGSDSDRAEFMDKYMKVVKDNQAQFQMLGNMRDKAIGKNHSENAGWALSREVGGEVMYVPMGVDAARDHVLGDLNKTDSLIRLSQHPHVISNLDEDTGNLTGIREKEAETIFTGLEDPRVFNRIRARNLKQLMTISAGENLNEFLDQDGNFVVGSTKKKSGKNAGADAGALKAISTKIGNMTERQGKKLAEEIGVDYDTEIKNFAGLDDDGKQSVVSKFYLQKQIIPMIRAEPKFFLMASSVAAKSDQRDALNEGKIRLKVEGVSGLGDIDNINKIIDWYNDHGGPNDGPATNPLPKYQP